ncbi:MAG: hypothetical protein LBC76_08690, partial [Treponema sp.]|jgi:hypothetical protein|nr:hypothetical protein [Treponema sp.]
MEKMPAEDLSGYIQVDFYEATRSGADYFILGFLEFQNKNTRIPSAMVIKIYSTNTEKLVFERSFSAGTGKNLNDEYQIAKDAGQVVVSNMKDM